ncbi:Phosphorelay intermediate protein [Botryosphaeria dothidea]
MAGATDHPEDRSEEGSTGLPDAGDAIDTATFEQILEMDDDEDEREFSKSIVFDFFQQAESTFDKMEANLKKKDLAQLSQLGHFLKGSSATLGLTKVKDSCEKIQHFGANKDETGTHDEPDDEKCLERLTKTIAQAKQEFKDVEKVLRKFYHDEATPAATTTTATSTTTTSS